jgi:hypothetical protein
LVRRKRPFRSLRSKVKKNVLFVSGRKQWDYIIYKHAHLLLGWNYYVQEPKEVKFVKKSYADNFKYSPGKLRNIKTK